MKTINGVVAAAFLTGFLVMGVAPLPAYATGLPVYDVEDAIRALQEAGQPPEQIKRLKALLASAKNGLSDAEKDELLILVDRNKPGYQ